ncbi:G5 domain-containing protein [Gardnerella sp. DNF00536]|uniref:aggregation-promoting factor C-terminal-like domain-containing protein n=1 Tax=Gardnerella sp. DNF00536 TaxID=2749050 RepID=UPI003BAE9D95
MTSHRKHTVTLSSLSLRQWAKLGAIIAGFAALVTLGFASRGFYTSAQGHTAPLTAYSATDTTQVSRGAAREALNKGATSYINVVINGHHRTILGTHFTDVKSVLEAGDITLEAHDVVTPSLTTKVDESTVITINRAGAKLETSDDAIAFNVVKKETAALPKGTEKVQSDGANGVMETTKIVTRAKGKVVSSNIFASYVKKAPKDKVILVGTGGTSVSSSLASSIGTTVPAGEMQQWAHDWLLSNGYSEADFTATVFIISHESGWRVNAMNPSGAYGLPQALPGGKMASAGADWATNYQTQLRWFWNYCNGRYGSIQGAYNHWLAYRSY